MVGEHPVLWEKGSTLQRAWESPNQRKPVFSFLPNAHGMSPLPSYPSPRRDKKKAKPLPDNQALIPGWEKILRGPPAEDAPTEASENPHTVLPVGQSKSRSSHSSTGPPSIPPSSSGDTSDDTRSFAHGFADDNELDTSYPQDMEETHPNDLHAALCYQEHKADSDAEHGLQVNRQVHTNTMVCPSRLPLTVREHAR